MGLTRDAGQAASDEVVYTPEATWLDDIPLPAPQVVQAILADGTRILYRSLADTVLQPSGRSVSGQAPSTSLTSSVNDQLAITVDGDGPHGLTLGTQTSGIAIAAAIQAAGQAVVPFNPANQPAFTSFRCDYSVTTPGAYTLRSGTAGPSSSVVVLNSGSTADASATLKLGLMQGGLETVGQSSLSVDVLCDTIGVLGNVSAGQINVQQGPVAGIASVSNLLTFANGREPASDDAYRQDVRSYILALGRGTRDAIERAVYATVGADGQRHVLSAQTVNGAANVAVFLFDGRSVTVGAQPDVIQAVQDELEGRGQTAGGWLPSGTTAGVVSATVLSVDVTVRVALGPTPDLMRAQNAISHAVSSTLYNWGVGQSLSYSQLSRVIDATVSEVFDIVFTFPQAWTIQPPVPIGGGMGVKIMPGAITVLVVRA